MNCIKYIKNMERKKKEEHDKMMKNIQCLLQQNENGMNMNGGGNMNVCSQKMESDKLKIQGMNNLSNALIGDMLRNGHDLTVCAKLILRF